MFNIVICDDTQNKLSTVEQLLTSYSASSKLNITKFSYPTGLINYMAERNPTDIIYINLNINNTNIPKLIHNVRKYTTSAVIILISSLDHPSLNEPDFFPFKLLTLPIDPVLFKTVFEKSCKITLEHDEYFHYKYNHASQKILLKEVVFFESYGRIIHINNASGIVGSFYDKLDHLEEKLKMYRTSFLRIHQSYLVNVNNIISMKYNTVLLNNNVQLRVSDKRSKSIRNTFSHLNDDVNS